MFFSSHVNKIDLERGYIIGLRWPAKLAAGTKMDEIMSVMDVFPTLAEAAGVEPKNERSLDGKSLWPAIGSGAEAPRDSYLFFASETPIRGSFAFTAFDDEWKLVQDVQQQLLSADVTNYLFRIQDDPYEYNDLAGQHPEVVADLSRRILEWRAQHPINGTRVHLIPPPGWRAPKDWATYPIPIDDLREEAAPGYPPTPMILRVIDWAHRGRGRLIYD